jgi:hypothetical protein
MEVALMSDNDTSPKSRSGRFGRLTDRSRDDFVEERSQINDWANSRGAGVLVAIAGLVVVFFVLAMFKVPL